MPSLIVPNSIWPCPGCIVDSSAEIAIFAVTRYSFDVMVMSRVATDTPGSSLNPSSSVTVNVSSCEPMPSCSVKSGAPSSFIISSPFFQTNEVIRLSISIELLPTRFTASV